MTHAKDAHRSAKREGGSSTNPRHRSVLGRSFDMVDDEHRRALLLLALQLQAKLLLQGDEDVWRIIDRHVRIV